MAIGKKTGGKDFSKGQSGNPGGRPKKGQSYTEALRAKYTPEDLVEKLDGFMEAGNFYALKYAYDRLEGPPKQRLEINSDKYDEWRGMFEEIRDGVVRETEKDTHRLHEEPPQDFNT